MPRRTASGPFASFHPIVRAWFAERFGAPSEPQRLGWPAIASGAHALILAPTGTGKTLAAFMWELNQLIVRGLESPLPNAVQILYISPLKALGNDVQRNLEQPLAELRARFEAEGQAFPEIRIGVRTGDTPASARARMLRKAPHILITTPESLNILLTSLKGRGMFSMVRAVIVDEIHAVAGTKRGAHLALTLERLEMLVQNPVQRIGLSATQRPLEEVAHFLGGMAAEGSEGGAAAEFRPVTIVDCGLVKMMELSVVSPVPDLGEVSGSVWPAVAELVLKYIRQSRTTLVFVNNRAQAERIAARGECAGGGADRSTLSRIAGARAEVRARAGFESRRIARAHFYELARARDRHRVGGSGDSAAEPEAGECGAAASGARGAQSRRGESRRRDPDLP